MTQYILDFDTDAVDISIDKELNRAVDEAEIQLNEEDYPNLAVGDEIIITKDGSKLFGGYVIEKESDNKTLNVKCNSYGYQLNNIYAEEIYENKSPEEIVQDLISNYTDLTYASTATSGVTLTRWVVRGYLNEEIGKLADILQWQIKTDPDKNFYFEPAGYESSGKTLEYGVNLIESTWKFDTTNLTNWVVLKAGQAKLNTQETFSGDGSTTEFTLSFKPIEVRVTVDGVERVGGYQGQSGIDYYVDNENKKIVFTTAPNSGASIVVEYTFFKPIVVEAKDNSSINQYGIYRKEIQAKWISTYNDARKYAKSYITQYSEPIKIGKLKASIDTDLRPGQTIRIIDDINNIDEDLTIKKITIKRDFMELEVGSVVTNILDWHAAVEKRIKELEKELTSTPDILQKYLYFSENLKVGLKISKIEVKYRYVNTTIKWNHIDSVWNGTNVWWGMVYPLILGHPTYGKLGTITNRLGLEKEEWQTHYLEES